MVGLKKLNLLFLEDNIEFAQNTLEVLKMYFKNVFHSTSIKNALFLYNNSSVDIIISDIKLEDGNGLDFIQEIRKNNLSIPIVILSAHKDEDFLFKAIPLHIFSYQLKPLSYNTLITLLKDLSNINTTLINIGKSLEYSYTNKELYEDGKIITLTRKEVLFIELLIQHQNDILDHEIIQRDIYNGNIMGDGALKNLIFRLRKKVDEDFITTITNVGYKLSR